MRCVGIYIFLLFFLGVGSALYPQGALNIPLKEQYATQKQRNDSQDNFQKGYYYFNNMAYEAAISFFRSAIATYPKNDLAIYWLGRSYYMAGYNDLAINTWEALLHAEVGQQDLFLQQELEKLYVKGFRSDLVGDSAAYRFSFLRMINTYSNPSYIASDSHNNLYISDYYKGNINIYNANLRKIRVLKKNIDKPVNLAFHNGLLYVSSFGNDTVQVFDINNQYKPLYSIGGFGFKPGDLAGPMGLAFSGDKLYVVDQGNNRVQIFQTIPKPYFIGSFGSRGDGEGQFHLPTGIAVYQNKIWVLDSMNRRIQIFDLEGNYLDQTSSTQIQYPTQIFVFQKKLYVVDRDNGLFVLSTDDDHNTIFTLLQKPTQGLQRSTSAWLDNNGILFLSEVSNPTVIAYAREVDKLSPLDLQTQFVTTTDYPKIILKLQVHDAKGRDIKGLSAEDMTVTQDGVKMKDIHLNPLIPENEKLAVTIVIQNAKNISKNKDSVVKYLGRIIDSMKSGDRVRLVMYNTKKTILQTFTSNPLELRSALDKLQWENEKIPEDQDVLDQTLYDSIDSNEFNDSYNALILVDSSEPSSFRKYPAEVIGNHAKRVGVPIYTVNVSNDEDSTKSHTLKFLSSSSGGKNFSFSKSNDLLDVLDIIRIHNPLFYTLSYTNPPLDRALHGYWANVVVQLDYRSLHGVSKIGYLVNTDHGN